MPYIGEKRKKYQNALYSSRRTAWLKENGPCKACGSTNVLQIDHIIPRSSLYALKPTSIWTLTKKRRDEELLRCQVLCKSCHIKKSSQEFTTLYTGKQNRKLQKVSDDQISNVLVLISQGFSERKACAIVGIARGTFSSNKFKGARKHLFAGA